METVVVLMGLLGLASNHMQNRVQYPPQHLTQHYYSPQTGKYYTLYNGYLYEQNTPYYQGGQGALSQNVGTPNWAPQPPVGGWYPYQQTQTAANPQGIVR